jgi:glycosyltransferase involved in cell wall biosynthesis
VPVLFDLDDLEHRKAWAYVRADGSRSPARWLGVAGVAWAVRRAVRRSRRTFVCSDDDARHVRRLTGTDRVRRVPNAVRVPEPVPPPPTEPALLFLGAYRYGPNADAAGWLLRQVWPRVRAAVPDARLVLAGPDSHRIPGGDEAGPGVERPGFVDDLDALYRRVRVACCPVRLGSGTRIKVLEAAAHARPVVATRFGAAGSGLEDGRHLLLRDSPADFAAACVALLQDDARAARLGRAARLAVAARFDRPRVEAQIRDEVRTAIDPDRRYRGGGTPAVRCLDRSGAGAEAGPAAAAGGRQ